VFSDDVATLREAALDGRSADRTSAGRDLIAKRPKVAVRKIDLSGYERLRISLTSGR
jgi:hypothetical protein